MQQTLLWGQIFNLVYFKNEQKQKKDRILEGWKIGRIKDKV